MKSITVRTLETYLDVALLEAEYWGTPANEPVDLAGLLEQQDGVLVNELLAGYEYMGMMAAWEYREECLKSQAWIEDYWVGFGTMWLIIAADLEQRINNVDEAYFA